MKSKIFEIDTNELQKACDCFAFYYEILIFFGFNESTGNRKTLNKKIKLDNIDLSIFRKNHAAALSEKGKIEKIPLEDILTGKTNCNNKSIKQKLIDQKIFPEKCFTCGIGNLWENKFLSLQLDHINGNPKDNRLENLRLLCPNCHSQTDTWGTKNTKKVKIVKRCITCDKIVSCGPKCRQCANLDNRKSNLTDENLKELIKSRSMLSIAKEYGLTEFAIRKRCKRLGLKSKFSKS